MPLFYVPSKSVPIIEKKMTTTKKQKTVKAFLERMKNREKEIHEKKVFDTEREASPVKEVRTQRVVINQKKQRQDKDQNEKKVKREPSPLKAKRDPSPVKTNRVSSPLKSQREPSPPKSKREPSPTKSKRAFCIRDLSVSIYQGN